MGREDRSEDAEVLKSRCQLSVGRGAKLLVFLFDAPTEQIWIDVIFGKKIVFPNYSPIIEVL